MMVLAILRFLIKNYTICLLVTKGYFLVIANNSLTYFNIFTKETPYNSKFSWQFSVSTVVQYIIDRRKAFKFVSFFPYLV